MYRWPAVKDIVKQYGPVSSSGRRSPVVGGTIVPEPTEARPGTPEKLAVLEERARKGQRLWIPEDRKV